MKNVLQERPERVSIEEEIWKYLFFVVYLLQLKKVHVLHSECPCVWLGAVFLLPHAFRRNDLQMHLFRETPLSAAGYKAHIAVSRRNRRPFMAF